mmetsp:Transcript_30575/g.55716  ORF Transcript_30575/g.55716 Transcript_30575/m.55716 type:complete len:364 (+) Transcript_30575:88-1179(+)
MPSVRDIVLARAKLPAKVHSMESLPARASAVSPRGALAQKMGGPMVVEYSAAQGVAEMPAAAARPPRPRGLPQPGTSPGSNGSAAGPRKSSEGRKPRAGSQPAVQRTPSEPRLRRGGSAGAAVEDSASELGVAAPKAKARASSLQRVRVGDAPPELERKNVGKVPGYLKKRNEEMAEAKRIAARPPSPQPPPGYRKVAEPEKQATLEVLRRRRQEVEKAQRQLPLKIVTVGQKKREKDLTDRLSHLDKLLSMFGQPTVFIPADAEPIADSLPPLDPAGSDLDEVDGESFQVGALPRGRSGGGDREAPAPRPISRERRSRPDAYGCSHAPWEQMAGPSKQRPLRTGVQVAAPPGGNSSVSLSWE